MAHRTSWPATRKSVHGWALAAFGHRARTRCRQEGDYRIVTLQVRNFSETVDAVKVGGSWREACALIERYMVRARTSLWFNPQLLTAEEIQHERALLALARGA